ncbi:MAG: hypothetical protein IJJ71_01080 [Treponema sp.]|uniref:hypothetical protein n=1 Tax=Treponema sp. TaxID=166 RepID=UPI0025D629BA|nr:hypothetical protein [Treponema sp.]MBR0494752.1 hypothetical protein [Treponema sp.]
MIEILIPRNILIVGITSSYELCYIRFLKKKHCPKKDSASICCTVVSTGSTTTGSTTTMTRITGG